MSDETRCQRRNDNGQQCGLHAGHNGAHTTLIESRFIAHPASGTAITGEAMTEEIIYIAGPMTGYPEYNWPKFKAATKYFRDQGMKVVCPTENGSIPDVTHYQECIKNSLRTLIEANAIAMLPGWLGSKGAMIEAKLAVAMGYKTYLVTEHSNKFFLNPVDLSSVVDK